MQKAHFKSSSIARLEAAIKAYATLSRFESLRVDVFKKLAGMLLHPFPRVCRSSCSEEPVAYHLFLTGPDLCGGIHVHGDRAGAGEARGLGQAAEAVERGRGGFEEDVAAVDGSLFGHFCCILLFLAEGVPIGI